MQQLDIDRIAQGGYTWPLVEPDPAAKRQAQLCGITEATRIYKREGEGVNASYEIVGSPTPWLLAQQIQQHRIPVVDVSHLELAELQELARPPSRADSVIDRAAEVAAALPHYASKAAYGRAHGMTRSQVCNLLRVHAMPQTIKQRIADNPHRFTLGHARVLAGLPPAQQHQLLQAIIDERLPVRATEERGRVLRQGVDVPANTGQKPAEVLRLEQELGELIGCNTCIDVDHGHLIIDYQRDLDVLQGVLERLGYRSA